MLDTKDLRRQYEAATPGEWRMDEIGSGVELAEIPVSPKRTGGYGCNNGFICDLNDGEYHEYSDENEQKANAAFIVAAHNHWNELLDTVERLEAEEEETVKCIASMREFLSEKNLLMVEEIKNTLDQTGYKISGEISEIYVKGFINLFRTCGGVNFVTTGGIDSEGTRYEVTVQKVGGLLPSEKMGSLNADNARLTAENERLREAMESAQKTAEIFLSWWNDGEAPLTTTKKLLAAMRALAEQEAPDGL